MENRSNIWLQAAILCGVLPLIIGTLSFFGWWFTRTDFLMLAGLFTIYAGVALFAAGIICLVVYKIKSRKQGTFYNKKLSLIAFCVLIFNFPLAGVYLFSAIYTMSFSMVTVVNEYTQPIENLELQDPMGGIHVVGNIEPGQKAEKQFQYSGEGAVTYTMTVGGQVRSGNLIGYISGGFGSNGRLVLSEEGSVAVKQKF